MSGNSDVLLSQADGRLLTEFVTKVDDRYLCVVCKEILKDAMQITCGHRLCQHPCVSKLFGKDSSAKCPIKEEACGTINKSELYPDFSARKEIKDLQVYCRYKIDGCFVSMPWKKLENHVMECPFRPVPCPNISNGCPEMMTEYAAKNHLTACQFHYLPCRYCGKDILRRDQQKHEAESCSDVKVHCVYNCGQPEMPRKEFDYHQTICPHKPKECQFKPVGCDFKGTEAEVQNHVRTSIADHLVIVTALSTDSSSRMKEIQNQLMIIKEDWGWLCTKMNDKESMITDLMKLSHKANTSSKDLRSKIVSLTERIIIMENQNDNNSSERERFHKEISALKHSSCELREQINQMKLGETGQGKADLSEVTEELMSQIISHDRQIGLHDVRLAEMDIHLRIQETISFDGVLIWKLSNYSQMKREAISRKCVSHYSQPFYSNCYGYKMCGRVYLNGDGLGKGSHLSLFFVIMRSEFDALHKWPFSKIVTLMILDQEGGQNHLSDSFCPDPLSSSFQRPFSEMNIASGCPQFVPHSTLETRPYLKDDTIFIKIVTK